jgi:hypothetical protein
VAFFNYYFKKKITKALHKIVQTLLSLSKTNKTTTKEVLRNIETFTRFCRIWPNHKYLYIKSIKNKELREYIVGEDDFAAHTNRTDDFALKTLNLIKRFKAKRPYHGKKHSVMQAEKKVFTIENSLPYLMRTAL